MSIEEKLSLLPGLITNDQGRLLSAMAREVPPAEAIVEIGSYKGKSTCYLAHGAKRNGVVVYAIDPWDLSGNQTGKHRYAEPATREAFLKNVKDLGLSNIAPIQGFSSLVVTDWPSLCGKKIGLLYIDGDHEENSVREDINAWNPWLSDSAIIAFDDLDTKKNPGVRAVVNELLSGQVFSFVSFEKIGNLGIFRK